MWPGSYSSSQARPAAAQQLPGGRPRGERAWGEPARGNGRGGTGAGCGFDFPVEWCGCFVAFAVVRKGGARVPERKRLALDTAINADATAGHNGFERAVSVNDAQRGDIVTFSFRHIGLCAGPTRNGLVHTIDGNSTNADGTNPHGGEVAEHRRPVSQVTVVGRLRY